MRNDSGDYEQGEDSDFGGRSLRSFCHARTSCTAPLSPPPFENRGVRKSDMLLAGKRQDSRRYRSVLGLGWYCCRYLVRTSSGVVAHGCLMNHLANALGHEMVTKCAICSGYVVNDTCAGPILSLAKRVIATMHQR